MTIYTATLTAEQADRLERHVREGNYLLREVPYARLSGVKKECSVTFYLSGKLVVQGKGTREFVEFILEPEILQKVALGYEEVLDPTLMDPRIGVDESGKGDFFGPLCIAGVYVNKKIFGAWSDAGVKDSKSVSSDVQIGKLAKIIRSTLGCVYDVVAIGNEAYNRMHSRYGSVNTVLAWGHARVIENLMERSALMIPLPVRAISDQFASSKTTVERALMEKGRTLELVQRHKAESDMAVAAASILARDEYVTRMERLEREYEVPLPKGASKGVEVAGRTAIAKHGPEVLPKIAKMHFRTAYRVLGLPEPAASAWVRGGRGN
ncbi:MAG: ribonuclease HIII [Pedosphaera sp.]|nr:ribonuclease HIII [Pedosphaera sp.]